MSWAAKIKRSNYAKSQRAERAELTEVDPEDAAKAVAFLQRIIQSQGEQERLGRMVLRRQGYG